jgi:DNA-binding ferritin-like protein
MKLSYILVFQNQLKIHHWFTGSYAEHKALQKAYESLDELFDTFVEVYLSKNGKNTNLVSSYELKVDGWNSSQNLANFYKGKGSSLITYLKGVLNPEGDKDLLNIVDEIEATINQTIYLLNLK